MATNMLSSLSLSGQFSRMIGAFANSCFHAARDGNFSWSISFRNILSTPGLQRPLLLALFPPSEARPAKLMTKP
ncbi:hypothetical protein OIU78_020083, partial [Salix suchowensis]